MRPLGLVLLLATQASQNKFYPQKLCWVGWCVRGRGWVGGPRTGASPVFQRPWGRSPYLLSCVHGGGGGHAASSSAPRQLFPQGLQHLGGAGPLPRVGVDAGLDGG